MKKRNLSFVLTLAAPMLFFAAGGFAAEQTPVSVGDGDAKTMARFMGLNIPDWLERTEFQGRFGGKPEWSLLTVQPLWESPDLNRTVFFQGSLLDHRDFNNDRLTTNIGFGYRQLVLDKKLLLGTNAFYDREWRFSHDRASVGFEARSSAIEANANYYKALSGMQGAGTDLAEQALDGWDAEAGLALPYLPWTKVFAQTYHWDGELAEDTQGQRYSLRLQPMPWLEVETGHDDNNTAGAANFVKVAVKLDFGKPRESMPLLDDKPFRLTESMEGKRLEKVRRTNKIVVERRLTAGGLTVSVSRGS